MSLIPDDIVSQIRERVDIVALIGEHVQLRKAGQSHKGLCPFHHERSPSFNVNGAKGFFYCFGCQKKGDAFTFLMELEGKSFVEAAQALAARAGVIIPEEPASPAELRARSERSRLLDINQLAAAFYVETLRDRVRGEPGRTYLAARGIGDEVAAAFRLGYAPAAWSSLTDYMVGRKVPTDLAEKVGLIVARPRGPGHYDRFRDRLMCPVILPGGEVVGFSGRIVGDGEPAKYINSPESAIYKKSHLLFGMHRAREAFRKTGRAILVEGNFDVISLHQAGFEETVAPLGTALTGEQVEQLRRQAGRVVLVYDGDSAGRAACLRSLRLLLAAGVETLILPLPSGEDPDSLVRGRGKDFLEDLLGRARPAIDYFAEEVWSRTVHSVDGQAAALAEAASVVAGVRDPVRLDLISDTLARGMGDIDVRVVRRAIARAAQQGVTQAERPAPGPSSSAPRNEAPRQPAGDRTPARPVPPLEIKILAILAEHPGLLDEAEAKGVGSLLTDGRLRDMYSAARRSGGLLDHLPDDPSIATKLLAGDYASLKDPSHALDEAVGQLRRRDREQELPELQRKIADAQRRGDSELARELSLRQFALRKQVD